MVIEQERDDSIIYSSAKMSDFMRAIHCARVLLRNTNNRLERVDLGKKRHELRLITHDHNGESSVVIAEYDELEQELTMYF